MFGLALNEKKVVLKSEFKKLFAEGFKIVSKKSKDNGTRLWIIIERDQIRSLALVTLNHFPQVGWFANTYHEDTGIPQLNCPQSLKYKFKRQSA